MPVASAVAVATAGMMRPAMSLAFGLGFWLVGFGGFWWFCCLMRLWLMLL
jgi:hypothetical protein